MSNDWLQEFAVLSCLGSNGHSHARVAYPKGFTTCPFCESLDELDREFGISDKLRGQLEKIGVAPEV